MILVADAGSSRIDWALIDRAGKARFYDTEGFNPYYSEIEELDTIIEKDLISVIDNTAVKEIYYYGSGCSTDKKKMLVDEALEKHFPDTHIEVDHDLLGAARALLGNKEGIACILGTGSNSCYYDGTKIAENLPSLGYLYGDEGSGTYMGKSLITAYLQNKLPEKVKSGFDKKYKLSLESILDASYNQGMPNRFLSAFSEFISEQLSDEFLRNMVKSSMDDFFSLQILKYAKYDKVPVNFTGSVAFAFKDILKEVAEKYKVKIGKIEKKPIAGLVEFHKPEVKGAF